MIIRLGLQVGERESEGGERMRSFGRSGLRRRKELKLVEESAEILSDGLLELSGDENYSS